MWIKFKVEGELEELIKAESEDECRTCSQQALYVLKNYYKNKKILNSSNTEQNRTEQNLLNINGININNIDNNSPMYFFSFILTNNEVKNVTTKTARYPIKTLTTYA